MKYIRTKDGRIIDFLLTKKEYEEKYPNTAVSYDRWFKLASDGYDIIKQADTIEELCDEFVVFDNNGKPQVYSPFDLKIWTTDNDLYGAIWTDKGLIYVAKMDKKGEMELL